MQEADKYELNADVAKSYDYAPAAPPVFEHLVHGSIDIRTVSLAKVEALIKDGNKFFIPKDTTAAKKAVV